MNLSNFCFPINKKKKLTKFCKILTSASYIPDTVITTEEIISKYQLPFKSNVIIKTIGVEKRHLAKDQQDDSDLLYEAAHQCLTNYELEPDSLTRIIVNKYLGDNLLPMTASRLQSKLGSITANHAFDVDGGASSFLITMDLASRYIATGDEYILIASGGIHNRLINKTDPRVAFLFGDASASLLLGPATEPHILASYFFSNHQFYHLATAKGMEFLQNVTWDEDQSIFFDTYQLDNWKIAEDFYRSATREIYLKLREESGLTIENIDLVLATENNAPIRALILETLGVDETKSISLLRTHGNTMSAMLPLLLDYGFKTGKLQPGMIILLIAFGEGISGGGLIYKV
ncbi:MAG: ketoacyl-ACP synthase III [Firmicutes bacterium]|nr:ketoacyl-ACP synthase III [Bacillota bacterium]